MGRVHEWHWSSGGRFTRRSSSGENKESSSSSSSAGCMSGVLQLFDFHQFQFPMSHQPCFKPHSATLLQQEDLQPCTVISKGVQAPRNSLESEEGCDMFMKLSPQSSSRNTKYGQHEHLADDHISAEKIQVLSTKPVKMGTMEGDHQSIARIRVVDELSSSESSIGSPGLPKTPTLVARLMGLDLLPENGSPSPSMSLSKRHNLAQSHHRNAVQSRQPLRQTHKTNNKTIRTSKFEDTSITGTRSLPETPRISSARKSDVDASRFSLQINKENTMEEFDYISRASSTRDQQRRREYYCNYRHEEEMNRSPSQYARQLVKQVKESVNRRVMGLDVTNTSRDNAERTEALAPKSKKQKRPTKNSGGHEDQLISSSKQSPNSQRIRSTEQKNIKLQISEQQQSVPPAPTSKVNVSISSSQVKSKSNTTIGTKSSHQQHRTIDKCKKASCERFTQRREAVMNRASSAGKANLNIQDQKKCKKNTPLSIKDLVVVNKEQQSISPTTQAQAPIISCQTLQMPSSKPSDSSQLSSSSSRNSYQPQQQQLLLFESRDDKINRTPEFRYVTEILKRTGIERDSIVSITRWFSPSHPLDPSIFDHLEHHHRQQQQEDCSLQRHNRRLIFDLVDEILVEILKPYLIVKPWLRFVTIKDHEQQNRIRSGAELLQQIWSKMERFPNANCQILQDIDDLIERDLPNSSTLSHVSEECESVVFEIERDLLDSLVCEIASRTEATAPRPLTHTSHGASRDEMRFVRVGPTQS